MKVSGYFTLTTFSLLTLIILFSGNLRAQEDAVPDALGFKPISQAQSAVTPVIKANKSTYPPDTSIVEELRERIKAIRPGGNGAGNLSASVGAGQGSKVSRLQKRMTSALQKRMKDDVKVRFRPIVGTPRQIKIKSEAKRRGAVLGKAVSALVPGRDRDERTARDFLNAYRALLRVSEPDKELKLNRYKRDQLGRRHLRYTQKYRGVPVWPAELNVHLDTAGNVDLMNGAFVSTPRKLVTQPVLDTDEAIGRAREQVPDGDKAIAGAPSLIVYAPGNRGARLAWKMELSVSVASNWLVVIDALNGATLTAFNQVKNENASGSGVDIFGSTRQLNVWQENNTYYMVDASKSMYDPTSDTLNPSETRGTIMTLDLANTEIENNQVQFSQVTSQNSTSGWLEEGVSLAYCLSETYDYYLERHGRNSIDGNGGRILGFVRIGQNYENAFWSSGFNAMFFGDGKPYAGALDIVAHEMTHGVTDNTCNLIYQDQSGALNESFSDIFGEMVEARTNGSTDWIHGTVFNEAGSRNLNDPSSVEILQGYYYPSKMSEFYGPNHPLLQNFVNQDNGGVHINMTIVAHAFYLLAQGLNGAIGLQDAASIFYRAQTIHLLSNSQLIDARLACIASAEELFGVDSARALKTAEAFDAVEIFGDDPTPEPPPVEPVGGPDSAVFICWEDGGYYLDKYEGGEEYYLACNEVTPYSRPSVAGDGSEAFFVDAWNDACFIYTDAGQCEECLGLAGEISSVAMSPDGQVYGFVFLDEYGEPYDSIGVIDLRPGGQDRTFQLVAPAIDGVSTNTILYADAMDFMSDNKSIIYDAYNVLQLQNGREIGAWSVYAIDLETEQTFTITTPVADTDVGYPALSQTTNHLITFDAVDTATGDSTVYAGNLISGECVAVGTVPGGWGAPVYNGDDSGIVYSYPDSSDTGSYLRKQPLAQDRITPQGSPSKAFDLIYGGIFGVIYRSGTYAAPEPNISVSPGALSFGDVSVGDSLNASLTISNSGTANLKIDAFSITGTNASEFSIVGGGCIGSTLVSSGTCLVPVAFSPNAQGTKTATLSIQSDDPDTPVLDVLLNGKGAQAANRVTIGGTVSLSDGTPLCAMALANGQFMFTCSPVGEYSLSVPLDANGKITLYGFCSGRAPFKAILTPEEASSFDIVMEAASPGSAVMNVTAAMEASTLKPGWVSISGQITTEGGTPLCAMVLANGQHMFTCSPNPVGEYSLDVPLDTNGEITLYGFCSGQAPFKQILEGTGTNGLLDY